jgi:hypothetical protein
MNISFLKSVKIKRTKDVSIENFAKTLDYDVFKLSIERLQQMSSIAPLQRKSDMDNMENEDIDKVGYYFSEFVDTFHLEVEHAKREIRNIFTEDDIINIMNILSACSLLNVNFCGIRRKDFLLFELEDMMSTKTPSMYPLEPLYNKIKSLSSFQVFTLFIILQDFYNNESLSKEKIRETLND